MTFTAAPPTFMQQSYYSAQRTMPYARDPNPPPYTEYAQELSYISAPRIPANDRGVWENTRNEAVRLLGNHSSSYVVVNNAYNLLLIKVLVLTLARRQHIMHHSHGLTTRCRQTTIRRLLHSLLFSAVRRVQLILHLRLLYRRLHLRLSHLPSVYRKLLNNLGIYNRSILRDLHHNR